MATKPSKTILNGCRVLSLMASSPRLARTAKGLAEQSDGELTEDQIESALLSYAEVGMVRREMLDNSQVYYLLGAFHLELASAELQKLVRDTTELSALLRRLERLDALEALIHQLRTHS